MHDRPLASLTLRARLNMPGDIRINAFPPVAVGYPQVRLPEPEMSRERTVVTAPDNLPRLHAGTTKTGPFEVSLLLHRTG